MCSRDWRCRASLSLLLMLLVAACSGEPERYRYTVSVAGGPTGWPIWVEDLTVDNAWDVPAGYQGGGFDKKPPGGSHVVLPHPMAVPSSVQARWFSYRNQNFYEISVELPDDFANNVETWHDKYPTPKYSHHFIVGFSGRGKALVWWEAFCSHCDYYDRSQDFSTPIIENVTAKVTDGDLTDYDVQTQELIDEGTIPSPW